MDIAPLEDHLVPLLSQAGNGHPLIHEVRQLLEEHRHLPAGDRVPAAEPPRSAAAGDSVVHQELDERVIEGAVWYVAEVVAGLGQWGPEHPKAGPQVPAREHGENQGYPAAH